MCKCVNSSALKKKECVHKNKIISNVLIFVSLIGNSGTQ